MVRRSCVSLCRYAGRQAWHEWKKAMCAGRPSSPSGVQAALNSPACEAALCSRASLLTFAAGCRVADASRASGSPWRSSLLAWEGRKKAYHQYRARGELMLSGRTGSMACRELRDMVLCIRRRVLRDADLLGVEKSVSDIVTACFRRLTYRQRLCHTGCIALYR